MSLSSFPSWKQFGTHTFQFDSSLALFILLRAFFVVFSLTRTTVFSSGGSSTVNPVVLHAACVLSLSMSIVQVIRLLATRGDNGRFLTDVVHWLGDKMLRSPVEIY